MRVLSIGTSTFQQKISKMQQSKNVGVKQNLASENQTNVNFKSSTGAVAGIMGSILGGAALIFAAPVAIIAGAAALGACCGAVISAGSEDGDELNDLERYKYTHEY